ncbi:hypothetical protein BN77_0297 [Rhizobium mesoamericanum STM3625]|uniref:Uncharacterized protein n=1 Tax=Rhizobium mesoamericanum STM3625 TaxID=1211777 RepID=K0Q0D2_9HYPH|nr:hypothetical protein BN77_0297 [Rhizobium mesoamericanum STM3625]
MSVMRLQIQVLGDLRNWDDSAHLCVPEQFDSVRFFLRIVGEYFFGPFEGRLSPLLLVENDGIEEMGQIVGIGEMPWLGLHEFAKHIKIVDAA